MHRTCSIVAAAALWLVPALAGAAKVKVVTTSSAYDAIARTIGGEHVEVSSIVKGYQDPHIVRPKPSMAVELAEADLFVDTGLDLEMWAPALVDMSNNPKIRSGQNGYVSVSAGLSVIEKPEVISRAEGDVHVYGNPHIHTSPLNGKVIARNICIGLKKVAPQHAKTFEANLARFEQEVDRRTFGPELVEILGGKVLTKLAESGRLVSFLEKKQHKGKPLIDSLGGWMRKALPLRGRKVVTFHKNWGYFTHLFGLDVVGYMEPKPGIPPSPGHVAALMRTMRETQIRVVLAANYFDVAKVHSVAEKVDAVPVIVALAVGGQEGMDDFFDQFDIWIDGLLAAFADADARS